MPDETVRIVREDIADNDYPLNKVTDEQPERDVDNAPAMIDRGEIVGTETVPPRHPARSVPGRQGEAS